MAKQDVHKQPGYFKEELRSIGQISVPRKRRKLHMIVTSNTGLVLMCGSIISGQGRHNKPASYHILMQCTHFVTQ